MENIDTASHQDGTGVTQDFEHAKASTAIGVLMVETVTNQQGVKDLADKIMDVLEEEFGDPSLTTLAALFSIAYEHAGSFLTPELVAQAQLLDEVIEPKG